MLILGVDLRCNGSLRTPSRLTESNTGANAQCTTTTPTTTTAAAAAAVAVVVAAAAANVKACHIAGKCVAAVARGGAGRRVGTALTE